MERRSAAVALAVVVALSGCAGFTTSQTPTVTPAPLPDETPSETGPASLAPGLTEDGIDDALTLSTTHFSLLRNSSYTALSDRTVHETDGTFRRERQETMRVDRNRMYRSVEAGGPNRSGRYTRIESWRNGSLYLVAATDDRGTGYSDRSSGEHGNWLYGVHQTVPASQQLFTLLQSLETDTTGKTPNGSFRVRATGIEDQRALDRLVLGTGVRNVSFEAIVTPEGLLQSYEFRYDVDRSGRTVRVVRRLRYRNVGSTTVDRPPWYDEALNATDPTANERA